MNNTVVNSDGPELLVQFDTRNNVISNNLIVAGPRHIFVENPYEEDLDNVLDANLYYAVDGSPEGTWQWKGIDYGDFDGWRAGSGNDRHSMFADPRFANAGATTRPARFSRDRRGGDPAGRGLERPQRTAASSGRLDRPRRLRVRAAASLADTVDRRPRHLRRRSAVAPGEERVGRSEIDRSNGERAPDDGVPMRIGTTAFEHGIGAHAPSRIVVDLGDRCSLFLADVGVDAEVGAAGSVVFEVWGGGELLATSGVVHGSQTAVPLAADVTGLPTVTLAVTTGGDDPANDHADWGDARFSCEDST